MITISKSGHVSLVSENVYEEKTLSQNERAVKLFQHKSYIRFEPLNCLCVPMILYFE